MAARRAKTSGKPLGMASGVLAWAQQQERERKKRQKTRAQIAQDILAYVRFLGGQITSRLPPLPGEEMTAEFPVGADVATFTVTLRVHPDLIFHGVQARRFGMINRLLPSGRFADCAAFHVRIGTGDVPLRPIPGQPPA
jgi:hypothetical protein